MRIHTQQTGAPKLLFVSLILIFVANFGFIRAQCNQALNNFSLIGDFDGSTYYRSNAPAQPMQAETIALNLGGHLVSINSAAENAFLADGIDEMTYIGLDDRQQEGSLRWTDGSVLNYTNYDLCSFCQDNDGENDYTVMHPWNGGWSFMNRWSSRNYIIEIPCDDNTGGGTGSGGNTGGGSEDCAESYPGFQFIGDHGESKYFLSNGVRRPTDAQSNATSFGGYLVSINDQAENDFLQSQIDEMVYIGLSDANDEGNLRWMSSENIGYRNIDTNCGFCFDNDQENDYTLMHPWNGQWSFMNQWSARRYIMEVPCNDDDGNNNSTLTIANCPADRVIQLEDGQSTAFVNWTPPTLTSTCLAGGISLGLVDSPSNNSNLEAGSYTIQYRGSNNCGDRIMCSFTVTINSAQESSLSFANCPSNINLMEGEIANWTPPSLINNCESGVNSSAQISGPQNNSILPEGSYTVRYRSTNNCGDVAICEFDVNVESGNQGSTISVECPGNQTFTANAPPLPPVAIWFFEQPTYENTCPTLADNGTDGVRVSGANPFNQGSSISIGTRPASFTASNLCGDTATCSWIVTVLPSEVPNSIELNCPGDMTFTIPAGQSSTLINYNEPTVNNICANSPNFHPIERLAGPASNTELSAGVYTIRYSARNLCENEVECSFQITVNPSIQPPMGGNVNYTAKDQVTPYTGLFRPGTNVGYNPPWTDEELANLAAGNPALGIKGIGAKTMRPGLFEHITETYGYDFRLETYEHYASLGMEDLTMIVGFPIEWHKDQTDYCGNGFNSNLFSNLYTDIWDDGTDGTPYNDENFYAAYLYRVVSLYGEHVKFWEIWNEPGFDNTGNLGWRPPGDPAGNWWDNDPSPCDYKLRAPIEHYVRTLRISWEIIKTLQPDDYVAVAGVGFVSFLDAILRNTDDPFNGGEISADYPHRGGAYFDVMGFHSYPDIDGTVYEFNQNGERIFNRHSDEAAQGITKTKTSYQEILDNYGFDGVQSPEKEWIITEINVPRRPFRPMAMSGGEELQVNYIIKAVVSAMKNDIRQIHVYNLGDERTEAEATTEFDLYGMHKRLTDTDPYTQVRNLEATAYKSAADFVFGSRYDETRTNQMNLPSNLDGIALRMNNGRFKYIIWAKTTIDQSEFASGTYSFPASFGYGQVYRRNWDFTDTDQAVGISSNNIVLNGRPIFITETANPSDIQARTNGEQNYYLAVNEILPNPAVDEIRLVLQARESDNYDIQIYDATGRLVEQRHTFIQRGVSSERFDISSFSHGMYFIILQDSQMRSTKVKFIKVENLD